MAVKGLAEHIQAEGHSLEDLNISAVLSGSLARHTLKTVLCSVARKSGIPASLHLSAISSSAEGSARVCSNLKATSTVMSSRPCSP